MIVKDILIEQILYIRKEIRSIENTASHSNRIDELRSQLLEFTRELVDLPILGDKEII